MAEPEEKRDWPGETSVEDTGPNEETFIEEDTDGEDHTNYGSTSSNAGAGSNWEIGILASLLFSNPHVNTLQVRALVRGVSRRYQLPIVLLIAFRKQNRQHIV
ncbi:hypothetical protein M0R45_028264 [Rubus argutus]|uniref:Uncharacterized protein n=1 Tax=Rubus argutus TaxID=59490 RepID=A0AAW1W8L3_RUBAR